MGNRINKKKQNILSVSRDLFWKHGFRRISVQEICEKAGVSKMTFYKYFPNKIELAKQVYEDVIQDSIHEFHRMMKEEVPAPEKIQNMILYKAKNTNNISREFMEDFYLGTEPELKTFVEQLTRDTWNNLCIEWKRAQEEGVFRKDFKPEFLIHISFQLIEMMKDEKLTALYGTPQELILEITRFIAYGISPRN